MRYQNEAIPLERKETCKCGKVSFDKRGAQSRKNELIHMGKERYLRIYQCDLSDSWHLTKTEFMNMRK